MMRPQRLQRPQSLFFGAAAALLLLAASCGVQAARPAATSEGLPTQAAKPSFICVGDGLTEGAFARLNDGWALQLAERFTRKADVVNRGFGGYFSGWFVDYMLQDLFDVARPTLAILFLGTKDTLTKEVSGSHYTPPEAFGRNVEKIMLAAKAAGVKHLLVITPPPVCETCKAGSPKPWDRETAHSQLYVDQLEAVAQKHGAAFLNIFKDWAASGPAWADTLLAPDKLHLSSAGNSKLYAQIMGVLEAQLPAVAWGNVPLHYPLMDVIDKDDPGSAFSKVQRASPKNLRTAGQDDGRAAAASAAPPAGAPGAVFVAGRSAEAQREQGQQRGAASAARGLAAQGICWILLGVAVTAWQLFSII